MSNEIEHIGQLLREGGQFEAIEHQLNEEGKLITRKFMRHLTMAEKDSLRERLSELLLSSRR